MTWHLLFSGSLENRAALISLATEPDRSSLLPWFLLFCFDKIGEMKFGICRVTCRHLKPLRGSFLPPMFILWKIFGYRILFNPKQDFWRHRAEFNEGLVITLKHSMFALASVDIDSEFSLDFFSVIFLKVALDFISNHTIFESGLTGIFGFG